jgi:hypothetical protein
VKAPKPSASESAWKIHGAVGDAGSGAAHPSRPPLLNTSSGCPSPVRSVKAGASLSTTSITGWRGHGRSGAVPVGIAGCLGFSNQEAAWPGKPTTSTSSQPSALKSRTNAKKQSE